MALDVHKIIAAINPDLYCDSKTKDKVKKLVKEKGFAAAAKEAEPVKADEIFDYDDAKLNPLDKTGLKGPKEEHKIEYDSPQETLEPIYFWLHDFLAKSSKKITKISDNFAASAGSNTFGEFGQRATRMQEEAMKMLGSVNTVIKSILNIIYDMKEFKIRLDQYDKLNTGSESDKKAAMFALKQVWLDNVDFAKRGNTSIKAMSQQFDYVTLIDAFMAAENIEMLRKPESEGGLDLNERVKRLVAQRLVEFLKWIEESEKELRKRYEIEKNYLKSQNNSIKLYVRWIKPYLMAAKNLEQNADSGAALVASFNTMVLELAIMAEDKYDPEDDIKSGLLPSSFKDATKRTYKPIVIVEFKFRGIPSRVGQGYSYGGRAEVKFTSYALHDVEIEALKKTMDDDDQNDALKLIMGATDDSLGMIDKDVRELLGEDEKKEEEKEESEDVNPLTALGSLFTFGFFKKESKKDEKEGFAKGIRPDNDREKVMRSQAIIAAREKCFNVFDTYKKSHGMPSHANPYDIFS